MADNQENQNTETTENTEGQNGTQDGEQGAPVGDEGKKGGEGSGKKATDTGGLLDDANDDLQEAKFEEGVKPEGLDDALWDDEKKTIKTKETFEALLKAQKQATDLRAKLGKGGQKAPKSADEYTITLNDDVKDMVKADDPVVKAAKVAAHKMGVSKEQFDGFMGEVIGEIAKVAKGMTDGQAAEPTEEEVKAYRQQESAKLGKNGTQVIRAVTEWGRQLHANGVLNEQEVQVLKGMGHNAEGVRVLNKLRTMMGGQEIPIEVQLDDGLPSDAEIYAMFGNEKYQNGDAEYVRKVEKLLDQRRAAGRPERLQVPA